MVAHLSANQEGDMKLEGHGVKRRYLETQGTWHRNVLEESLKVLRGAIAMGTVEPESREERITLRPEFGPVCGQGEE